MSTPRFLPCFAVLALTTLLPAQTHPTAYTVTQALPAATPVTQTVYRSGTLALVETRQPVQPGVPAQRTLTLYDLKAGVSHTWDPSATPINCNAATFSGDWGDPYESTAEITDTIIKASLKPTGAETLYGIPTKVYAIASQGMNIKAWFDEKDGLVIKAEYGAPGGRMTNMIDIRSVSLGQPPASLFVLPAACASVKPPPTAAELMAEETGDSGDNFVSANYGPGSKNSCTIVLRVVAAKTMAPITRRWQAAIDTTFNQDDPNPRQYQFGVGNDGAATFAGAGIHEITSQIHNDILRIENPPAYFNLAMNVIQPGHGTAIGLLYRQCFAPVTMLYYILKDPNDPGSGGDYLYAKAGKYATVPAH